MGVDEFFKQIERRTERDLYRKSFRFAYKSQQTLLTDTGSKLKLIKKKKIAKEVFWFFMSLVLGFLIGYLLSVLIGDLFGEFKNDFVEYLGGKEINVIFLFWLVSFIGVYLVRIVLWSLNSISK